MMHDVEAASPRWKLNPKNFYSNINSIKFLGSGVKLGSVGFAETTNNFWPTVLVSTVALMVRCSVRLSVCRLYVCNVLYCG